MIRMNKEIAERIEMIKQCKIPDGYKKVRSGIIPNEWSEFRLDSINTISTGLTPLRSKNEYFNGDINWVKTTDLNNSYIYYTEEKITNAAIRETSLKYVEKNSILIAMYGGFNQIGRTGLMRISGTTNQAISSFYIDEKTFNSEFVLHWLNSNRGYWNRLAASSRKDPNITKKDVEDFPIVKLPYLEQKKIANIISTWDKSIELKEKLLKEKQKQKKGLIERLLIGKVRLSGFNEKWYKSKLSLLLKESIEKSTENNQYDILSVTKEGIYLQSEYFNRQIASEDNIGYKVVRKNELVFSTMNLWMGSIDIVDNYEVGIVSPACKVFKLEEDNIDASFMKYFSKSSYMMNLYKLNSEQGASVVRRNLDLAGLLSTKIKLPDIKEQVAIGKVLRTADKEIDLLKKELESLKDQKKGLMQLLLTGIVRVKCD